MSKNNNNSIISILSQNTGGVSIQLLKEGFIVSNKRTEFESKPI